MRTRAIGMLPVVSTPGGMPRGSLPKVNSTAFSRTMPSATVAISQELEPRAMNGRTATRSTATPHSAQATSARTTASASGQPSVTQKVKHSTAPSIMVLPWAHLIVVEVAADGGVGRRAEGIEDQQHLVFLDQLAHHF